jgi:ribosomal-protein-alanine N-acetyltransferase
MNTDLISVNLPTVKQKEEVRAHIRWMIRRDMPEALTIENESFEFPWLEDDFIRCLRQRNCIGMVAEHKDKTIGFMIYELHKTRIHVLSFAVAENMRRHGVGSQMVAKLIAKLSQQRRSRIILEVRETNLEAQLFFRECGFRAVSVLHSYYADTPEDSYFMEYRLRTDKLSPKNVALREYEFYEEPNDDREEDHNSGPLPIKKITPARKTSERKRRDNLSFNEDGWKDTSGYDGWLVDKVFSDDDTDGDDGDIYVTPHPKLPCA